MTVWFRRRGRRRRGRRGRWWRRRWWRRRLDYWSRSRRRRGFTLHCLLETSAATQNGTNEQHQ